MMVGIETMRLQDFMSRDVETTTAKDTIETAYQKMKLNGIRHLVVMEGNTVVGILSERDLSNLSERERENQTVQGVMEIRVATASPDTTVREAANLMRGRTIGCLPVLENHKLVGIVTTTDLLDLLGQGIERITPDTSQRLVNREHPGKKPAGPSPNLVKT